MMSDQLTIKEMQTAVNYAYVNTGAFESVGKPIALDFDGPNQVGSFTQGMNASGTGFANATVLAQTWNKDLAFNQGLQKRLKNFAERYPECCYLSNSTKEGSERNLDVQPD